MNPTLPPGPELTPEEQTFQWFSRPYAFLKECARDFGPTFTVNFKGLGPHVFFSQPADIQTIFSGDINIFHAGEGNAILRPFLGSFSLLQLDEAPYSRHRKMMLPPFQVNRIQGYLPLMREIADEHLQQWVVDRPFSVQRSMLEISLEIILRVIFGVKNRDRLREMRALLSTMLDAVAFSPLTQGSDGAMENDRSAWTLFQEKIQHLNQFIADEIRDHRAVAEKGDVLSLLLSASEPPLGKFSDEELRDELVTLLLAGHETTATTLAWAFYWVLKTQLGESLTTSKNDDYLEAVIKETLRITPVIPVVSRRLTQPVRISTFDLPAGLQVVPCIFLTHHREELYPEPDRFNPERFLSRHYGPYEYLPFGGGIRRCLGMPFAMAEMKTVLTLAFQYFDMELIEPPKVVPVRRSVVIAPTGGTKIVVTKSRLRSGNSSI